MPSTPPPSADLRLVSYLQEPEVLYEIVRGEVAKALEGDAVASLTMVFPHPSLPKVVLALSRDGEMKRAAIRAACARPALEKVLVGDTHAQLCYSTQDDLLGFQMEGPTASPPPSGRTRAILAHVSLKYKWAAALHIELLAESPVPDHRVLGRISAITQSLARAAPLIAEREILRQRGDQLLRVQEAIFHPMIAPDKGTLLNGLASIIEERFGFSRCFIALAHGASRSFHREHLLGFDSSAVPFSLGMDQTEQYAESAIIRAIASGEVKIYVGGAENPAEIQPFAGNLPVCGAALIPLCVSSRSLGFIYADRPKRPDVFLVPETIKLFARLASAAVESFLLRNDAEEKSLTDPLTQLYNRRYLDRVMEIERARIKRYGRPISMMMIDLCDFKKINDRFGHVYGDEVLRETAAILKANVRDPDIVVRFGGDEFVVLLPDTDVRQAKLAQDRIEKAFGGRNAAGDNVRTRIEISIGLSSANASNIDTLLERADKLMYEQKTERAKGQIIETLLGLPSARADALDNVISSLLTSLKKREPFYQLHSHRVAFLCLAISQNLGLSASEIRSILLAALLHDVGKVSLPGEILQRPGPLEPSEREAIRAHPVIGEEFFRGLTSLEASRPFIRHHHERFDGVTRGEYPGYPAELSGEAIPLGARILKLADSVDAMLSERPYKHALPLQGVIEVIRSESGASFDPKLVELICDEKLLEEINSPKALAELYDKVMRPSDASQAGFGAS
ncbi:diguanylate cyclase [Candidatus Sumerlaeota bacterium]|nr:diguanylate cyclase [Candidatus Sumerlaeota bacterium]MBI3737409.1 diguanylate cyclase [Candidatus Sumerlaeota bacterium]